VLHATEWSRWLTELSQCYPSQRTGGVSDVSRTGVHGCGLLCELAGARSFGSGGGVNGEGKAVCVAVLASIVEAVSPGSEW